MHHLVGEVITRLEVLSEVLIAVLDPAVDEETFPALAGIRDLPVRSAMRVTVRIGIQGSHKQRLVGRRPFPARRQRNWQIRAGVP